MFAKKHKGLNTMISIESAKRKCCEDISLIENYQEALNDKNKIWVCHHRLELHPDNTLRFTHKSLKKLGLYFHRPARELIFLTKSKHSSLHNIANDNISFCNSKSRIVKPKSIFGKKFFEKYNMVKSDNPKLYDREQKFFHQHGKCRWEV